MLKRQTQKDNVLTALRYYGAAELLRWMADDIDPDIDTNQGEQVIYSNSKVSRINASRLRRLADVIDA